MTKPQNYRDVSRFLRSQGWENTRTRGSHHIWQPADRSQTLSIPVHSGIVKAGIVRQVQTAFTNTPSSWN
ncbi:type II toxin-antitoxin system HicA family toxin [Microbacterium sp. 2P01SA-2]|uniref:type II toxin-antitoxin system HicA family toxin n=1 Tax=Microbacterium TaxID=33882 RepID=UPI001AE6F3DD|nr:MULTISPECIES: type II toxin-antitoxin system HicA family toxin [Microbacterium]MBP2422209.1 putative RNA binding protein YcfA (HicA-like mRNA interferase family) [Microbacterium imperiale]MDD7930768.1 type II toxin-antitoxin system HicA family toxin [Microbacterium thalli]MDS0200694.1 type II toxin-antitoxin system HicA family toxin [Microbacterium imperiale]